MTEVLDRREAIKRHYAGLAKEAGGSDLAGVFGSASVTAELRAPYLYAEERLLAIGLEGKTVLDYGCGQGAQSVFLAKHGARVTGVDLSEEALAVAERRARENGVAQAAAFRTGDCEALPFAADSFDIVFSSGNLFCLDADKAFSEMARVLKPAGRAVLVDTLGHNPVLRLGRRIKRWLGMKKPWAIERIPRIEDLLRARASFGEVELSYFDFSTVALAALRVGPVGAPAPVIRLARELDRRLLSGTPLKRWAFKVVAVLSFPRKDPRSGPERAPTSQQQRSAS